MRCITLAIVLSTLLWVSPSPATIHQPSNSIEEALNYLLALVPGAEIVARYRGKDAEAFMSCFNAFEPVTNFVGDEIIALRQPRNPLLYGLLGNQGIIVTLGWIPPELWRRCKVVKAS